MTEIIATVGMVMNDRVTGTKYRIIYISNEKVVVCKMEDTKLILLEYDQELIIQFWLKMVLNCIRTRVKCLILVVLQILFEANMRKIEKLCMKSKKNMVPTIWN